MGVDLEVRNSVNCDNTDRDEGVVIVVDPYSSGRFLIEELERRDKKVVSIRSTLEVTECITSGYDATKYFGAYDVQEGDTPEMIVNHVQKMYGKVQAVFAGCEAGVILTDALNHALGFKWNDPTTSDFRRHKAAQQDCLRDNGLRAVKQIFSDDIQEMLEWRRENLEWPVVIKPALSGGTDGVYFCSNDEDIVAACEANLGRIDILGNKTEKVLMQEFLKGLEYVVDTMSRDGEHVLAAIWVYAKDCNLENGSITYDNTELLPAHGEIQDQLIEYIMAKGGVLDVLGIEHGPAHAEIMMTPTGPCLVEVGNRMHGCDGPKTVELCTGAGQHQLYADIIFDGELFEKFQRENRYTLHKKAICLTLKNLKKEGRLLHDIDCPELRCMRSVVEICGKKKGDMLVPTRCLITSPGDVLMMHPDEQVVWEDIDAIRKLEATGILYHVEGDEHVASIGAAQSDRKTGATNASELCVSALSTDVSSPPSATDVSSPPSRRRVASEDNIVELTGADALTSL